MKGEGMDKVREALPELPASQAFSLTRSIYTADDMHAYARAAIASKAEKHAAELAKLRQGEARAVRDAALSGPAPSVPAEERFHLAAMTAASNAEKEARVLLATLKPATKGAES